MLLLSGCDHDERVISQENQKALLNPEIVGTNSNGRILYRVYLHTVADASGEYFYYWEMDCWLP
jgi:hypothetical protein